MLKGRLCKPYGSWYNRSHFCCIAQVLPCKESRRYKKTYIQVQKNTIWKGFNLRAQPQNLKANFLYHIFFCRNSCDWKVWQLLNYRYHSLFAKTCEFDTIFKVTVPWTSWLIWYMDIIFCGVKKMKLMKKIIWSIWFIGGKRIWCRQTGSTIRRWSGA